MRAANWLEQVMNKYYLTGLLPNIEPEELVNADGALKVVLELPNKLPDVVFAPNIFEVCPVCPNRLEPGAAPKPPEYDKKTS